MKTEVKWAARIVVVSVGSYAGSYVMTHPTALARINAKLDYWLCMTNEKVSMLTVRKNARKLIRETEEMLKLEASLD